MESGAGTEPVQLFLVGLSEAVSRSLARYLRGNPSVALSGVVPSFVLAGILLPAVRPDLALMDWSVLGTTDDSTIRALRLDWPRLRIVCVVTEAHAYQVAASRLGVDGVISRDGFDADLEPLLRGFFPERFLPL